jgi:hypothetical protein
MTLLQPVATDRCAVNALESGKLSPVADITFPLARRATCSHSA